MKLPDNQHSLSASRILSAVMPVITTPITPLEARGDMFQRAKTQSFIQARSSTVRPLSEATEIHDSDFEDHSSFEDDYSPKSSFESVSAIILCDL